VRQKEMEHQQKSEKLQKEQQQVWI
jgi:hypothetical protein